MREQLQLTEQDGYEALRAHVVDRALAARAKHGPDLDEAAMRRLLEDPEVVRFPTTLVFDATPLRPGEFAWAAPVGERPAAGFVLYVHPHFHHRPEALPALIAYHVPSINYLDVVTGREAELFGAALLGLEVDDYYQRVCAWADELGAPPEATLVPSLPPEEEPVGHTCGCGKTGGCHAG